MSKLMEQLFGRRAQDRNARAMATPGIYSSSEVVDLGDQEGAGAVHAAGPTDADRSINVVAPILQWLGEKKRAGGLTPQEQRLFVQIVSSLVPGGAIAVGVDEMQEAKKRGETPDPTMLMAGLIPGGRTLGAVGKGMAAAGRATEMLPTAAMVGAPVAMAMSAGEAQAGEADPVKQGLEQQLSQIGIEIEATRQAREAEAKSGRGPKYDKLNSQMQDLLSRQNKITAELRAYKTPEDIEAMEGGRWDALKTGAAIGGGVALPGILAAALMRRKGNKDFAALASEITKLSEAAKGALPGTKTGDRMAAMVNEAYRAGEASMPFLRRGNGQMRPASAAGSRAARARADERLFEHGPPVVTDKLMPLVLAEGAFSTARGAGVIPGIEDTPEERALWTKVGLGSLAGAGGYKGMRKLAANFMPSAAAADRAVVTGARSRLEREMAAAEEPGLLARLLGGASASSGSPGGGRRRAVRATSGSRTESGQSPASPPQSKSSGSDQASADRASQAPASLLDSLIRRPSKTDDLPAILSPSAVKSSVKPTWNEAAQRWQGPHGYFRSGKPPKKTR